VNTVEGAGPVEITDEALMTRYQSGDVQAFASLVARHKRPLFNFVLRQIKAQALAEDLVQEVFLRIIESSSSFKHEARFSTWAYTIARNLCVDHLRKAAHRRHPSLEQPDGQEGDGARSLGEEVPDLHPRASTERGAVSREIQLKVVTAVESLPPEQREVFLLRHIADLPFLEIALITATPENTVKSRMRYALERLQEALTDFEEYARALR
jgi:RNA polymerase sigma-70 factor (ECF subfamily)